MLGSDAHREEDVGDFTRTEKILKEMQKRNTNNINNVKEEVDEIKSEVNNINSENNNQDD